MHMFVLVRSAAKMVGSTIVRGASTFKRVVFTTLRTLSTTQRASFAIGRASYTIRRASSTTRRAKVIRDGRARFIPPEKAMRGTSTSIRMVGPNSSTTL